MDQSTYCSQIDEVKFEMRDENLPASEREKSQLREVLGALQWRAYSTAPQHLVQLSMLQSQVNAATVKVLKMANKLVREVYHSRHLGLRVTDLGGIDPRDVVFVAFSDAAVGNRPDLSSTGGYIMCQQPYHFGWAAGSRDASSMEERPPSTGRKIFSGG